MGPNDVYVDGDLIFTKVHGDAELAESQQFLELAGQIESQYGHVLMLTDATEGFGLSTDSRRYAADWAKRHRIAASAVFGASAQAAAMILMLARLMSLFSKSYQTNVRFFSSEAEARRWLELFRAPQFRRHTY